MRCIPGDPGEEGAVQNQTNSMGATEWALLVVLSVLWGGSFFFSKIALQELPTLTVVFLRVGVAACALAIYMIATGLSFPTSATVWLALAGMGLLNNLIPFCLLVWGQTSIASGLASILNATTPVFSLVIAHVTTADEKMTPNKWAGVAFGIAGVAVLIGQDAWSGMAQSLLGMIACLGAALSYGIAGVFGRRFRAMGIAPTIGAFGQVAATTCLMLPLVVAIDEPWTLPAPSVTVSVSILGLGLLSTAVAYVLYFRILAVGGATNASLVTLLIPVSAIMLGSLVLGENLAPSQIFGMALIGVGLLAIDGGIFKRHT
jgi:drug/metabolite transporter (DMT)-like permease